MNDDFAPFELAVKLKEKGFREECLCHYIGVDLVYNIESPIANNQLWFCHNKFDNIWHRDNVDAPTISQVLKWLREEKKIHIVSPFYKDKGFYYYVQRIGNAARIVSSFGDSDDCFDTTEQAAVTGIEYVLDNLI